MIPHYYGVRREDQSKPFLVTSFQFPGEQRVQGVGLNGPFVAVLIPDHDPG
jgi:hypothetical protein